VDVIDTCGSILPPIVGAPRSQPLYCRRRESHSGGHTDGTRWWSEIEDAGTRHERCRRCGGPNVAWSAPSPLWNFVIRGNDINGDSLYGDLVCMTCFVMLAAEAGLSSVGWRLTLHPEPDGLVYETPSGRTWNAESFLWEESR
jgi:hypothetical protein